MIRLVTMLCMALVFASASVAQETPKSGPSGTAVGHYELSKAELALDCRKLTGKMQIRILQIRDYVQRAKTSTVSRLAQQGLTPIYGGTQYGADPDAQYRRDLAMLYAYNRQLAAKKCNTFDLDAELKPQPIEHTPRPVGPKQN